MLMVAKQLNSQADSHDVYDVPNNIIKAIILSIIHFYYCINRQALYYIDVYRRVPFHINLK